MNSEKELLIRIFKLLLNLVSGVFISVCVLIYTFPAAYVFFGYVSLGSVVTNIVVVPLSGILMQAAAFAWLFDLLGLGSAAAAAGKAAEILSSAMLGTANSVARTSSVLKAPEYVGIAAGGAILVFAVFFVIGNKRQLKRTAVISGAVFLAAVIAGGTVFSPQGKIFVSSGGGVAASCGKYAVVYGVDDYDDYSEICSYLLSQGLVLDVLIVPDDSYYSALLTEYESADTALANDFDDYLMNNAAYRTLQVRNRYAVHMDGITAYYDYGSCTVSVCGVTVGSNGCDITLNGDSLLDSSGEISLSDGSIVYDIQSAQTYSARRKNLWEK